MNLSGKCTECSKEVPQEYWMCWNCAEKAMKSYCGVCMQYSRFRHTKDTSITMGVAGGSARWSQRTWVYLPPNCYRCEKPQNYIPGGEILPIAFILAICCSIFVAGTFQSFTSVCLTVLFILGPAFLLLFIVNMANPVILGIHQQHMRGEFLLETYKSELNEEVESVRKAKSVRKGEPKKTTAAYVKSNVVYPYKIKILFPRSRKSRWIEICSANGIIYDNLSIPKIKSRISAWNKLIDLQRGRTTLSLEEHLDFVNNKSDFVLMSKTDLLAEVKSFDPGKNHKSKNTIELLRIL